MSDLHTMLDLFDKKVELAEKERSLLHNFVVETLQEILVTLSDADIFNDQEYWYIVNLNAFVNREYRQQIEKLDVFSDRIRVWIKYASNLRVKYNKINELSDYDLNKLSSYSNELNKTINTLIGAFHDDLNLLQRQLLNKLDMFLPGRFNIQQKPIPSIHNVDLLKKRFDGIDNRIKLLHDEMSLTNSLAQFRNNNSTSTTITDNDNVERQLDIQNTNLRNILHTLDQMQQNHDVNMSGLEHRLEMGNLSTEDMYDRINKAFVSRLDLMNEKVDSLLATRNLIENTQKRQLQLNENFQRFNEKMDTTIDKIDNVERINEELKNRMKNRQSLDTSALDRMADKLSGDLDALLGEINALLLTAQRRNNTIADDLRTLTERDGNLESRIESMSMDLEDFVNRQENNLSKTLKSHEQTISEKLDTLMQKFASSKRKGTTEIATVSAKKTRV